MPGLIDVHVHIALFAGEVNWDHLAYIKDDYLAVRAYTYLNWWVLNGFTTIFEPFARNDLPFELRRALRNGIVNGPRLLVSGGGITGTASMVKAIGPVEVTGAEETRRKVRVLTSHEFEVDVVKIRTTAEMLEGIVESRLRLTPEEQRDRSRGGTQGWGARPLAFLRRAGSQSGDRRRRSAHHTWSADRLGILPEPGLRGLAIEQGH